MKKTVKKVSRQRTTTQDLESRVCRLEGAMVALSNTLVEMNRSLGMLASGMNELKQLLSIQTGYSRQQYFQTKAGSRVNSLFGG